MIGFENSGRDIRVSAEYDKGCLKVCSFGNKTHNTMGGSSLVQSIDKGSTLKVGQFYFKDSLCCTNATQS